MSLKILGIDPGSRVMGFALVQYEDRRMILSRSGVICYDVRKKLLDRLGEIYRKCVSLREEHEPDQIAIESLISVKSISAHSKLAQARGAMIAAFSHDDLKLYEYSPTLVKASIGGYGHAGKESVSRTLQLLFGKQTFQTHDESDALAIAVCHILNFVRTRKMVSKGFL